MFALTSSVYSSCITFVIIYAVGTKLTVPSIFATLDMLNFLRLNSILPISMGLKFFIVFRNVIERLIEILETEPMLIK
jgi:hypothetical protein